MAMACIAFPAAVGYDATQQAMINGTSLSWKMATAYAAQDIPTFDSLAEQWNAWVRQYFGEDPNLLMQKMNEPADLTKPYILANNTSGGIVHKIDGINQYLTTGRLGIPGRDSVGLMLIRNRNTRAQ